MFPASPQDPFLAPNMVKCLPGPGSCIDCGGLPGYGGLGHVLGTTHASGNGVLPPKHVDASNKGRPEKGCSGDMMGKQRHTRGNMRCSMQTDGTCGLDCAFLGCGDLQETTISKWEAPSIEALWFVHETRCAP